MNHKAKAWLVVALVAVVGMAFRVSWNALRDIAHAVGADKTAATLYPIVVDGLMALALVATLVLEGPGRKFALRVLAGYTLASLALNYVHGLVPLPETGERMQLADWPAANYALVLLATSLPVGAIYFGSDLVAKVLHHEPTAGTNPVEARHSEPETAKVKAQVNGVNATPVHPASASTAPAASDKAGTKTTAGPTRPASLAICGGRRVFPLTIPPASTPEEGETPEPVRLNADEALKVIHSCWVKGVNLPEAAARSTRSTSYVFKVYKRLEAEAEAPREPSKELVLAGS